MKSLFGKSSEWQNKYVSIKGRKFYVYKDQNYNKPETVVDLNQDIQIKEVRKADMNGKENVMCLTTSKDKNQIYFAASTPTIF